jgi:hypothetical protein
MKYKRICAWCNAHFIAKRVDQIYHTTSCRNAANSFDYRQKKLIYKQLADATKKVDEKLKSNYSKRKQIVIKETEFKKRGIDIAAAIRVVINQKNEIVELRYGYYSLIHEENRLFKLIKN